MSQLGNRILTLRKEKSWSQSELAKMVGVTYVQIGRYETAGPNLRQRFLKNSRCTGYYHNFLMHGNKDEKARAA